MWAKTRGGRGGGVRRGTEALSRLVSFFFPLALLKVKVSSFHPVWFLASAFISGGKDFCQLEFMVCLVQQLASPRLLTLLNYLDCYSLDYRIRAVSHEYSEDLSLNS